MERWYLPVNCHLRGRVEKYLKKILDDFSGYVRRNHLGNLVPIIFFEQNPEREFFLFIGIESEQKTIIPEILQPIIRSVGHPLPNASLDFDAIKPMVSNRPVIPLDYARRVTYREQQVVPQDDPFDFFEEDASSYEASSDKQFALSEDYNRLLYWLSTVGNGTWQTFQLACKALGLDQSGVEPRRILRRLRLLGHLEVSHDGTHWAICPACLVAIRTESRQKYVLAGRRSMQLLQEIEKFAGFKLQSMMQPHAQAPALIHLDIDSEHGLHELLERVRAAHFTINNVGNIADKFTEILPSLTIWKDSLIPVGRFYPALYEITRFSHGSFEGQGFQGETGMYRLQPRDKNNQVSRTLFYNSSNEQWLQGDWYGLRFLALRAENTECKAVYHTKAHCLALPVNQRWPDLYERALVLCSGQLADQQNGWLFFKDVPREIALKLAHKLTATYEEVS